MKNKNFLLGLVLIFSGVLLFFASPAIVANTTIAQAPAGCSGSACDLEKVNGYDIYKMTRDNGEGEDPRFECCKQACPPNNQGCKSGTATV